MHVGMKVGSKGGEVKRLHRALAAAGAKIAPHERTGQEFGPSTLAALHDLQRERGLPIVDEIDQATFAVLFELKQNITINIAGTAKPATDESHGRVSGRLVDRDGAPLPDRRVSLFARAVRAETHIGDSTTTASGEYDITYARRTALNLVARAYDASGSVIAESTTAFAAHALVQLDLTTSKDGVVRSSSRFATLSARIAAQLHGTPLDELKVDELRFLARSSGTPFGDIAYLFLASVLGRKHELRAETLFGCFYEGIPASLDAALTALPDGGLDDAFQNQVFAGVLAHERGCRHRRAWVPVPPASPVPRDPPGGARTVLRLGRRAATRERACLRDVKAAES